VCVSRQWLAPFQRAAGFVFYFKATELGFRDGRPGSGERGAVYVAGQIAARQLAASNS
jgi:hypothetical protein